MAQETLVSNPVNKQPISLMADAGFLAARIHATSGIGKVIIDPCFSQIDKTTFQSPGYERAADRVEITAKSGAGNVSIRTSTGAVRT